MKTPLQMTLAAALPLVSVLWMTPPAFAHDTHRAPEHQRSWSDSSSYRDPSTGRYTNWVGRNRDGSWRESGRKHRRYHKAMPWLSYPEWEARRKAPRRSWEQPQPFALEGTPSQD